MIESQAGCNLLECPEHVHAQAATDVQTSRKNVRSERSSKHVTRLRLGAGLGRFRSNTNTPMGCTCCGSEQEPGRNITGWIKGI